MSDESNSRRSEEVLRIQGEIDSLERLPEEVALALSKESSLAHHRVDDVLDAVRRGLSVDDIVAREKAHFDALGRSWSLDRNVVGWLQISPFMSEFTRWIRKRAGDRSFGGLQIGTAAAVYNPRTEEIEIVYNPRFMASLATKTSEPGHAEPHGSAVNEHEHMHLMLGHVTSRRRDPASLWNIAADLAENSLIARNDTASRLPSLCLLPGVLGKGPVDPKLPKEVKEASDKLRQIIAGLPQEMTSEWYFQEVKRKSEQQGYEWGKKGMKVPGAVNPEDGSEGEWVLWPSDQHEGWDDVPEELRDIVESKIKNAMRRACDRADNTSNGWGNIPSELREEIRAYCRGSVDWKAVLRNWTGMRQPGGRSRSIKRVDRRFPYVHGGLRRNRNPAILVMVDQSGSVDDGQLARIYGALEGCSQRITFDVVPFDVGVSEKDLFTWKRGTRPKLVRARGGGTDFDSAVAWANAPERRGRWDGVIIATDGECSKPRNSRVKLAWLVTPGHKLLFVPEANELVIQMPDKDIKGDRSGW